MNNLAQEQKARLNELELALKDRGVVDVKFDLLHKEASTPQLADEMITMLESILGGNYRPSFGMGDSNFPEPNTKNDELRKEYNSLHGTNY